MEKYCLIENGKIIKGPVELPKNWNNISNFYTLDSESLKQHGWLPIEVISENKPVYVKSTFTVFPDKVLREVETRDRTDEEIAELEEETLKDKWENLRFKRNELLQKSDILVLVDNWQKTSDDLKQKIIVYRQQLRDLPMNTSNPFNVEFPNLDIL